MKTYIILISILLYASPCFGLEVEFLSRANVSKKSITLGDIAHFSDSSELAKSLKSQIVAKSPKPGDMRLLNTRQILDTLGHKLSLPHTITWKGAPSIKVTHEGVEVNSSHILSHIENYLDQHRGQFSPATLRFIPKKLPLPFYLPKGDLSYDIFPSNPSILKSSRFSLIFKVNGKVKKNMSISGKLEAIAPVAVAKLAIARGTILQPNMIQIKEIDITRLQSPCHNLNLIIGKRATKSISVGSAISLTSVASLPIIKKGQLVKIIVQQGDLMLSAIGISRMNGTKNQIIRVQNSNSRKIIFARVAAPGIVEVKL